MNDIEALVRTVQQSYDTTSRPDPNSNPLLQGYNTGPVTLSTQEAYVPINETHVRLNDGTYLPKYDTYDPFANNNEVYAQNQGTGEKWANGIIKFGGKTLNATVGGIIGSANGLYEWMKTGSSEAVYSNDVYSYFDDLQTMMDTNLPNYYTQAEQELNPLQSMGTANFWANDVLGGLSFTVGAIASELLIGKGAGLVNRLAGIGKASRLPQIMSSTNKAKKASTGLVNKAFSDEGIKLQDLSVLFGKGADMAKVARFTYTSSGYEASIEAQQFKKEQEQAFQEQFFQLNGRTPEQEEVAQFVQDLDQATNSLWLFNVALTGSSNMMQFGSLMGIKAPSITASKWANRKFFGAGVTDAGKLINPTKYQKGARKAYGLLKGSFTEGFEEGMQSVGAGTAESWLTSQFDPKYSKNNLDLFDAFSESFVDTFTTSEGLKEVLIGSLIGGLTGGVVGRVTGDTASARFKQMDKNAKDFTTYTEQQLGEMIAYANLSQRAQENLETAEKRGDFTAMEQARKEAAIAQISYAESIGYGEEGRTKSIIALQNIDVNQLAETYGVTVDQAEQYKREMIDSYNNTYESYQKHKEFAKYYIGDDFKNSEQIHKAVASVLTMGEGTYDFNQTVLATIKQELGRITLGDASLLDVKDTLSKATLQTQQQVDEVANKLKDNREALNKLEAEQKRLMKAPSPETAERMNELASDIMTAQENKVQLENELNILVQTAALENPYSKSQTRTVTEEDLNKLDEVLQQLSDLPSKVAEKDLQTAIALENLITEYNRSNRAFKEYANLSRELATGKFNAKELAEKVFGEGSLNSILAETYESFQTEAQTETQETAATQEAVTRAEIKKKDAPVEEETPISKLIEVNPYLQYKGAGISQRPTAEEIQELENLRDLETTPIENEDGTLEINFDPLTEEQKARKAELEDKLGQWELYDGFLNEGVSLLDMVEMDQQLNQQPEVVQEQPVTQDEFGEMTQPDSAVNREGARFEEVSQTYDGVQIRNTKDGTFLHSTDVDNFVPNLSAGVITDTTNGVKIDFPDGTTATLTDVRPGVVKVVGWENIENNTTTKRMNYTFKQNTYSFVYSDGRMIEGALQDNSLYNVDAVYDLKEGSGLRFRVDGELAYNRNLTEEELQKNLKIYIVDSKGNIIGDVKADSNIKGTSEGFKMLRLKAVDTFKRGGGFIPMEATVKHIHLGTPVFELNEAGIPVEQSFDPRSVIDWGYYDGNNFELVNESEGVRTSFVRNLARRVPVIIFRRGSHLVAFPVNLKGDTTPKGKSVTDVLTDENLNIGKAVIQANQILLDNGLNAVFYYRGVNDQNIFNPDGSLSEDVQETVKQLDDVQQAPDILQVQQNELPNYVSSPINFGSNPITSPKVVMDLDNLRNYDTTPVPEKVEQEAKAEKVEQVKKVEEESAPQEEVNEDLVSIPTTIEDFIGERVLLDGEEFTVQRDGEGSPRVVLVNNERIIEPDEGQLSRIEIIKSPYQVMADKYEVSEITETSIVINGYRYEFELSESGGIVGLMLPKGQVIRNESMLVFAEIERNRSSYIKPVTVQEEALLNEITEENEFANTLLEGVYGLNMNDTVGEALDKLYEGVDLNENERLNTYLWLEEAFVNLNKLRGKNDSTVYQSAEETLTIISHLLYENERTTVEIDERDVEKRNVAKTKGENTKKKQQKVENSLKKGVVIAPVKKEQQVKEKATKQVEQLKPKPTPQTVTKTVTNSVDGSVYNDYTFNEGSTAEDFKAVAQEGSSVSSPTDVFVVEKGMLKSRKWGDRVAFPANPQGWRVSNKVEILSDQNTKSIQNKKCK